MLYPILTSVIVAVLTLLHAEPAFVINGQIQDNTGKPACGVRVCAIAEDFDGNKPNAPISCVRSDSQGKFAIAVNKASKYQLFYDDTANGHWPPYRSFFRHPSASIPEVLLSDDNVSASITISEKEKVTKLEWSPVEGAVSYSVEVDYCEGDRGRTPVCVNPQPLTLKSNASTSGIVSTSYEFHFVGAQAGRWRVWALDKEGREGFKSPWRRFIYLR